MVYYIPLLLLEKEGFSKEVIGKIDKEFVRISNTADRKFTLEQITKRTGIDEMTVFKFIMCYCVKENYVTVTYFTHCPKCNKTINTFINGFAEKDINTPCPACNTQIGEENTYFNLTLNLGRPVR